MAYAEGEWGKFDTVGHFVEYEFPVINHIDQMRNAIAGRDEFREYVYVNHTTIDYVVTKPDTFAPIAPKVPAYIDRRATMLRECRGIIFDNETGAIIRRPPHKFFNVDERPEVARSAIDWKSPHVYMEKLDGSCVSAYVTKTGRLIWGSPAGETMISPMVERFVTKHPNYAAVARYLIDMGYTPTFEFCSLENRVVIAHPVTRLVLTCVRNIATGVYLPYSEMVAFRAYGIEVVRTEHFESIDECLKVAETMKGVEGWVIRFASGHMLKVKTEWYRELHGTVTGLKFEKDVLSLILNKTFDDAKPFLHDELVAKIEAHEVNVHNGLMANVVRIVETVDECRHLSKGEFVNVVNALELPKEFFSWLMYCFDIKDQISFRDEAIYHMYEKIRTYVAERTHSSTWVDRMRPLYGNHRFEF